MDQIHCRCTIKRSGIEVIESKFLRYKFCYGAFACTRRTVYSDDLFQSENLWTMSKNPGNEISTADAPLITVTPSAVNPAIAMDIAILWSPWLSTSADFNLSAPFMLRPSGCSS